MGARGARGLGLFPWVIPRKLNNMKKKIEIKSIGSIGNYYGGLHVCSHEGKFYWIVENYDTNFDDIEEWEEISEKTYTALLREDKLIVKRMKNSRKDQN